MNFADRLNAAIDKKGSPSCVGLDPLIERLPPTLLQEHGITDRAAEADCEHGMQQRADALTAFGLGVIDAVAPHAAAIKINIAFFERYYDAGIRAYHQLIAAANEADLIVIGDIKRADIGHSTTQYALAQLKGMKSVRPAPDAVTVNPYFGYDAIKPFVEVASDFDRGLFILVQTSNGSAAEIQGLSLQGNQSLCQQVAALVQQWASEPSLVGRSQYSCIGAVVSPRDLESTRTIRRIMPNCIFLVPGFGAQGRTTDEVAECFNQDGRGALITSSRGVIYAFEDDRYSTAEKNNWKQCVANGAKELHLAVQTSLVR